MYTPGTNVTTLTGETATIISNDTVDIEHEDGSYSESTTYTAHIAGQGTVTLHETKVLCNA